MASKDVAAIIPLQTIRRKEKAEDEEKVYSPGPKAKPFVVPAQEAERLVKLSAAKYPEDEDDEEESGTQRPATRAELEESAKELGIDLKDIKGTGKGGALKNADIESAIAAKVASNAGEGSGGGSNPSVVE